MTTPTSAVPPPPPASPNMPGATVDPEPPTSSKPAMSMSSIPAIGPLKNPVLRRELLERVRGVKAAMFVSVWLTLLIGILLLAYLGTVELNNAIGLNVAALGRVGRELFEWVLFGMLLLVLFLVPGLTAGSVTGERERQTLVPLQMTMMGPYDIIIGKLAAALAFLVLLVITALPLLATSLLVGGIGVVDVLRGVGMILFTGLVLGSVCVWISSRFRRTTAATVACYALTLVFTFGSFVLMIAWAILEATVLNGSGEVPPAELLGMNPFAGVADALPRSEGQFGGDTSTPFGGMRSLIDEAANFGERGRFVWVYYVGLGSLFLGLTIRGAAKQVTVPSETER